MSGELERTRTTQRGGPQFRPVAILGLIYFAAFFCLFGLLLVLPELNHVLATAPADPEAQEAAAKDAVHAVFRPRMPYAFVLALLTTAAGARFRVLPGFRF